MGGNTATFFASSVAVTVIVCNPLVSIVESSEKPHPQSEGAFGQTFATSGRGVPYVAVPTTAPSTKISTSVIASVSNAHPLTTTALPLIAALASGVSTDPRGDEMYEVGDASWSAYTIPRASATAPGIR